MQDWRGAAEMSTLQRTRVPVTAVDAQAEDAVLKRRVRGAEDGPVPLVHGEVVAVLGVSRVADTQATGLTVPRRVGVVVAEAHS